MSDSSQAPSNASSGRSPLRLLLIGAGALLVLCAAVFTAAWFLMPRDFIQAEARRQAGRMSDASVRWDRLQPGFQNWSLGVTVRNLDYRSPATGPARIQARVPEAFVRFRLLPLFMRRVEVDGARVEGGAIVMTDRGPMPPSAAEPRGADAGFRFQVPRIDLERVSLRTRDALGTGYDLKRVSGHAEIDGTLDRPRAIRLDASVDSIYWKPEGRGPILPLPSPGEAKVALEPRDGGRRLVVTEGNVSVGPLVSAITGEVRLPPAPAPAQIALRATGGPQTVRSTDAALRAISGASPAAWSATASWDIKIGGTARDMTNEGRIVLKPFSVSAQSNTFSMDQASVVWASGPDRSFVGRAEGFGGGITFTAEARGAARAGAGIGGTFYVRAPAERMNGLVANGPTWTSGELEVRGNFASRPPAAMDLDYTVTGTGFAGTVPGVARPVRRLTFAASGTRDVANVTSVEAVVGSTTASVTGQVRLGAVRTGTFDARIDRFVVDEWTLGPGGTAASSGGIGGAERSDPIPFTNLVVSTRIGELRARGLVVRNVTVPIRYAAGKLVADPIQGTIGSGTLKGALDVSGIGKKSDYTLHMDVNQVPVEELVSGLLPVRLPISGTVDEIIDLRGSGVPGPQSASTMRGTVTGKLQRGYLRQSPALKNLRAALGTSAPPEIPFEAITHAARIADGKLLLDKVTGDLGKDLFSMTGALGFDQSLDLNALLRLAPERVAGGGFLAQLARYARDENGRIPVEVKITGSALTPKVTVKPAQLIEVAGKAFFKEQLKGVLGKGRADSTGAAAESAAVSQPRGKDVLKRILGGRAKPDTSNAASKPDTTRAAKTDSAANPIQKALERLLGK